MSDAIIPERSEALFCVEEACRYLAQFRAVEDVKEVRDRALAFAQYARERGLGQQAEKDACEIRIRAERRMGELLAQSPSAQGRRTDLVPQRNQVQPETLSEIGVTKQDSHRWQKMAAVPDEAFEKYLSEARTGPKPASTADVLKLTPKPATVRLKAFNALAEAEAVEAWLRARRDGWPETSRLAFVSMLRRLADLIEEDDL